MPEMAKLGGRVGAQYIHQGRSQRRCRTAAAATSFKTSGSAEATNVRRQSAFDVKRWELRQTVEENYCRTQNPRLLGLCVV